MSFRANPYSIIDIAIFLMLCSVYAASLYLMMDLFFTLIALLIVATMLGRSGIDWAVVIAGLYLVFEQYKSDDTISIIGVVLVASGLIYLAADQKKD